MYTGLLPSQEDRDGVRKTARVWKAVAIGAAIIGLVALGTLSAKLTGSADGVMKSVNVEKQRADDPLSVLARQSNMDVAKARQLVEESRAQSAGLELKGDEIESRADAFAGYNGAINPMQVISGRAWAFSPGSCSGATKYGFSYRSGSRLNRVVGYFLTNGNLAGLYVFHEDGHHQSLGHRTPHSGYSVSFKTPGNAGAGAVTYDTAGPYVTGFSLMWDDDKTGDIAKYAKVSHGRNGASFKSANGWATAVHLCADAHGVKRLGFWFE